MVESSSGGGFSPPPARSHKNHPSCIYLRERNGIFAPAVQKTNLATDGHGFTRIRKALVLSVLIGVHRWPITFCLEQRRFAGARTDCRGVYGSTVATVPRVRPPPRQLY